MQKNIRARKFAVFFATIFSVINCIGFEFQDKTSLSRMDFLVVLMNALFVGIFVFLFYLWIRQRMMCFSENQHLKLWFGGGQNESHRYSDLKYFLACFLIILFFYSLVFLAYYPGMNNYDAYNQIKQTMGSYSTHHPIAHTLYLKFFLYHVGGQLLHDYTAGWAIGIYFQMAAVAATLSYVQLLLYRLNAGRKMRIFFLSAYAANPLFAVLAISSTKDIFFSIFFVLSAVCVVYWTVRPAVYKKKRLIVLYMLSLTGIVIFRNNGIYGLILMLAIGGIYMFRRKQYRFLVITVIGIMTGICAFSLLKAVTKASSGTMNEALSIPYQQMAFTYNVLGDELLESEKQTIKTIVPTVENYEPHYADKVKNRGTALQNSENVKLFVKTYLSIGLKHPLGYIEAFIQNNLGYLYVFDTQSARIQRTEDGDRWGGLTETELRDNDVVHLQHTSYFPWLENLCENLFTYNEYWRVLPYFLLCSVGFYFWSHMLILVLAIDLKCTPIIINATNLIGFFLTIFFGPMVAIRYALPYMLSLPVMLINLTSLYSLKVEEGDNGIL